MEKISQKGNIAMSNFKISIVMPVYNTKSEYLEQAVSSVLKQSYSNFELILVDDGSREDCALQCDQHGTRDSRITVIHQKNAGVSTARNCGTELASGDYVMYMDSDDLLAAPALQEAVDVIDATGAQFVFAGIQQIRSYDKFCGTDGKSAPDYHHFSKDEMDFVVKSFFTQRNPEFMNIQGVGAVNRGPCARLVRTDIAKANRFEGRLVIGEDVEWNMRILRSCDSVCFVSSVWYGYLIYETSSLRKYYGNRAQLLEEYHTLLYQRNRDFCERDPVPYGINMAVSFYSMAICEYLSAQCPLTAVEKRRELKQILGRAPWTHMTRKDVFSKLPGRYRLFLTACRFGLGIELLQLWGGIKKCRKS